MAHQIEQNMLAFVGTTPWHGLGTKVAPGTSGEEMMRVAGLNWEVGAMPIFTEEFDPMSEELTSYSSHAVREYRAIARLDEQQNAHTVFTIASGRYEIVQNAEIIDLFSEYCEAGSAVMETVGGLNGGAVVWALARLKGADTNLQGIDPLHGYILLSTSHDGSLATTARATQVRVVCHNTLTAALAGTKSSFKMRHSTSWTPAKAQEAKDAIGAAVESVCKLNEASATLSKVVIDHSDWLTFMGKLMGDTPILDPKTAQLTRLAQDIQDATVGGLGQELATAKGTLFGAVMGVSYFTDHKRGRTQDARLVNAWFGASDALKSKAMNVALEMATA